ncbi:MAG: DVU3141 family protein [Myxococcota bacterium]
MVRTHRCLAWGGSVVAILLAGAGCASSPPTDHEIWHESGLRPGRMPPDTPGERELLARLPQVPVNEPVNLGGQVFVADEPYHAASGRTCRPVTVRSAAGDARARVKLACEERGSWVFVPDPFDGSATAQAPAPERGDP